MLYLLWHTVLTFRYVFKRFPSTSLMRVHSGAQSQHNVDTATVIVVGKRKNIQAVKFESLTAKFGNAVSSGHWNKAIELVGEKGGTVPLHYSLAKLVVIGDSVSRCNATSNSMQIFQSLRKERPANGTKVLSVALVCEYHDVLSSVAAIARSFPTFSMKTDHKDIVEQVHVDVVLSDGKKLSDADLSFVNNLYTSIRETARLIDTPANIFTTDAFVDEALKVAKNLPGVETTVIRGEELKTKGFGGIYHVGKAGPTPPAFVVLSYKPAGSTHTYAMVGKGVVFDTGGLSIKPKAGMPNMKRDMGGAAGLLHSFALLVQSGFKHNLHVCLCIVENNISPIANKPDDIITLLSGKTCEINNTDAEGRLILADGVYYAKHTLKADTIIDMATLTYAQSQLSGRLHCALMANKEESERKAELAGRRSGDLVKSMVFAPDLHFADLKSPVADMRNANFGTTQGPLCAIAGLFIGAQIEFGEGLDWMHFDMLAPGEFEDRATGFGPSLFAALLGEHTKVDMLH